MKQKQDALFKSEFGENEYFKLYKRCLDEWPTPYTELDIDTSFGKTYFIVSGNPEGKPVLLFHGMAASPASWYPNVTAISSEYKIYAPNYPGDFGLSDYRKSPLNPDQAAAWVNEICSSLKITEPICIGTSFGAFLSANYTIKYPGRTTRLILISPAGIFAPLKKIFFIKLILGALFPKPSNIRKITEWLYAPHNFLSTPFTDVFEAAMAYGRPKLKYPPAVFSDSELESIQCPVLLLLGEHEVIGKLKTTVERANKCVKNITCKIIPDAGHLLPLEQCEIVNKEIAGFLG